MDAPFTRLRQHKGEPIAPSADLNAVFQNIVSPVRSDDSFERDTRPVVARVPYERLHDVVAGSTLKKGLKTARTVCLT